VREPGRAYICVLGLSDVPCSCASLLMQHRHSTIYRCEKIYVPQSECAKKKSPRLRYMQQIFVVLIRTFYINCVTVIKYINGQRLYSTTRQLSFSSLHVDPSFAIALSISIDISARPSLLSARRQRAPTHLRRRSYQCVVITLLSSSSTCFSSSSSAATASQG
jgi:hypothetical protein